jgi:Tol biopolymer transport system component/DNA-binding winged helix-turn-helix (wHTH) protein
MPNAARRFFCFGSFRLEATDRLLFSGDRLVPLTPKAIDLLVVLVENHGRVLTKQELIDRIWPDTAVEENNLIQNISLLRKVLGDAADVHQYIDTIPRRGYRFIADVRDETQAGVQHSEPSHSTSASRPPLPESGETPAISSEERPTPTRSQPSSRAWIATIVIAAMSLPGAVWLLWNAPATSGARLRFSRLTSSGRAILATLSTDGKYLAYVLAEPEGQTLRIRQVHTGSEAEVRGPVDADYWGLTLSPDGTYLYFVSWMRNRTNAQLFRVPVLGGAPQHLIEDVGSPITFSPTGERFAFVREHDQHGNSVLMTVSVQDLRPEILFTLARGQSMAQQWTGPAWSPDGSMIAVAVGDPDSQHGLRERRFVAVDVRQGTPVPFGTGTWFNVSGPVWAHDSNRLLFTASTRIGGPRQIWTLSFPSGAAQQLTDDLNDYGSVSSMDARLGTLAAIRTETVQELWLERSGAEATLLASEVGNYAGTEGFCWTPDGRIVFAARNASQSDLWVADIDKSDRRQLTGNAGNNFHPAVSPDGRYIVFASDRTGHTHLWRVTMDGSEIRQLTSGHEDARPRISPDGQWVVYQQGNSWGVDISLWKVSIEGGAPVKVADDFTMRPTISPDGRWIAHYYMDQENWGIGTIPLAGGEPRSKFPIPPTARERAVRWIADGTGLVYVNERGAVSELWVQPLAGGSPQRLRSLPMGRVSNFEWSFDGQHLAWGRSIATSDVVRIEHR